MFATIVQCDMRAIASSHERGDLGRILATRLSVLPGFVTFVALDADAETGRVAALCIFDDRAGLEAAEHAIDTWQQEYASAISAGILRFGTGPVIVQKGL
jgi:hypothetical protein